MYKPTLLYFLVFSTDVFSSTQVHILCVFVCEGTESQVTETLTFINVMQMHYHHTHNYLIKTNYYLSTMLP